MPSPELPRPFVRRWIIAALTLSLVGALSACSMVKIGYGQASPFTFRWLDRYLEFDDAQSLRVRTALDDAMAWHRRTQLPEYAQILARAEVEVLGEATPERMCAWGAEIRAQIEPVLQHLAPTIADVIVTLSPAQLSRMEKRFAETNDEWRDDHLQRNPQRRQQAQVKRAVERAEMLYGRLDEAQRELVVQSVSTSPYDADIAYAERKARQNDVLALARRLSQGNRGAEEALVEVRAYLKSADRSPRESYRAYAGRVAAHNCMLASALQNAASPAQRREAAKKLAGYRADLRALMGEAAG